MIKPLLRIIPNLSGNVKLCCTLRDFNKLTDNTFETNIRGALLNPLSHTLYQKNINVNIPGGIDNDQTIRVAGEGEAGTRGGTSGDLFVHVTVKDHEFFVRDGNNILLELPITFSQAALGDTIEVKTIHGPVKMTIKPGTQTGDKYRLSEKGIDNKITRKIGHQIVIVKVITPTNLTAKQKELFKALAETDETSGNKIFDRIKKFFKK